MVDVAQSPLASANSTSEEQFGEDWAATAEAEEAESADVAEKAVRKAPAEAAEDKDVWWLLADAGPMKEARERTGM